MATFENIPQTIEQPMLPPVGDAMVQMMAMGARVLITNRLSNK